MLKVNYLSTMFDSSISSQRLCQKRSPFNDDDRERLQRAGNSIVSVLIVEQPPPQVSYMRWLIE